MLEQFPPRPDDTVEISAVPTRRPIALLVSAAVVAIGVLVGVGFLAFGGLGGPGNGGGGRPTTGLPAISPDPSAPPSTVPSVTPSDSPTAAPTMTAPPVPVTATPTLTPTTLPTVAVSIANASMKPPAYQGANCPGSTTAVATVVASGPVTITYEWTSTLLAAGGSVTFTFAAAGSHQFRHPFTNITTPNGQVTAAFVVVTPVARRASMSYTQKCGAKVTKVSILPDPTRCQVQFRATLHAGVGPMTVRYHWVYNGVPATGPGAAGTWLVTKGGGQTTTPASPKVSDAKTVTAILVIDSPVRNQSAKVSAICT